MVRPDWFQASDLGDGVHLFAESLGLPPATNLPINSHLIIGAKKAVLFDTGTGLGDIWPLVRRRTRLPVIAVCSHSHWDHTGGNVDFPDLRVHAADLDEFTRPKMSLLASGLGGPGNLQPRRPRAALADGDVIDLGSRCLRVVHSPGHSPGSICLYEEERGLLFTADAAVAGGLPLSGPEADPALALESLRRLLDLGPAKFFPGHGPSPGDPARLGELASALEKFLSAPDRFAGEAAVSDGRTIGWHVRVDGVGILLPPRKATTSPGADAGSRQA